MIIPVLTFKDPIKSWKIPKYPTVFEPTVIVLTGLNDIDRGLGICIQFIFFSARLCPG